MLIPYLLIAAVLVGLLAYCLERCETCGRRLHTIECPERDNDRLAL